MRTSTSKAAEKAPAAEPVRAAGRRTTQSSPAGPLWHHLAIQTQLESAPWTSTSARPRADLRDPQFDEGVITENST